MMRLHPSSRLAWIVAGSGIFFTLAALAVGYLLNLYSSTGEITVWYRPLVQLLPTLSALLVGGLIAARRPQSSYGWIWLLLGWGGGVVQPWSSLLAVQALAATTPRTFLGGFAVQSAAVGWLLFLLSIPLALLLFPTGALPSPRWRRVTTFMFWAGVVAILTMWAIPGPSGIAPTDNPFGLPGLWGAVAFYISTVAISIIFFFVFPLSVLSLFVRYRQSGHLERTQLRWLLYMAAFNVLFVLVDSSEIHRPWISEDVMTDFSNVALAGLPLAVAVAILRYRLYDIDIIIRRTLQYSVLTGLLGFVYLGSVILLQRITGRAASEQSPLVIVVSTLLIAALFSPLRRRVQAFIDRRFYRQKVDAQRVLARFAQTARDEVSLKALTAELTGVIWETMQPEKITIWLRDWRS